MARDSFIFYASFWAAMKKMTKTDKLAFVEAICGYALEDQAPSLTGNADLAFGLIKPQLDANMKRRANGEKGKEFGKLGGRPVANNNPIGDTKENPNGDMNANPVGSKSKTPNVNVYNKCIDKEKSIEKKVANAPAPPKKFVKPTLEQIKDYVKNMGYYGFDAERFLAYYESNGWRVGRNPMKDWEAAIRNWHRKDKEEGVSADYISRTQIPDPSIYDKIESTI